MTIGRQVRCPWAPKHIPIAVNFHSRGCSCMAGNMFIELDRETLTSSECSLLVHNGRQGRLAFSGEDGRIELLSVAYAVDAGTIVCYVPVSSIPMDRAVTVAFEAHGAG